MGCDSGVLVSDKAFAGSDTWSTSYVLAASIRRIAEYDLIICGERATDGDTGQVGPGIAAFLDLPVVNYVGKVDAITDRAARVHRLVEDGHEVLEVHLPAVLTVVKEIGVPRLPTLLGKQKAKKAHIPIWGPDDLTVETQELGLRGSPTRVVKIFRPKVTRKCERIAADDEARVAAAVDHVVSFLQNKNLI
jgi:electron transfer flavoprotein beta subunit